VAAVVVIAVLGLLGVFGGTGSSAGSEGTATDLTQALTPAMQTASATPGGPWTIFAGEGLWIASGLSESSSEFAGSIVGSDCPLVVEPNLPATLTVDGTPSSATPGEVAAWFFLAANATGGSILVLLESDGSALALGVVSGSSCTSEFSDLSGISATSGVNSTAIAANFNAEGGTQFLRNESVQYQLFILVGGTEDAPSTPDWFAEYSTCNIEATSGTGLEFFGGFDAATGDSLTSPTTESETC
jgi:hypothetical protein